MSKVVDVLRRRTLAIPRRHLWGPIRRAGTREPIACLTFDDGPDPETTPRVLDLLRRYGARATFFMVGAAAAQHPELLRRVAREGHAIGNHSWDHPAFTHISWNERRAQLGRCRHALAPYAGTLFRPPYGMNNTRSNAHLYLQGYLSITWSVSPEDCFESSAAAMLDTLRTVAPGDIVLMHDNVFDQGRPAVGPRPTRPVITARSAMLAALEGLLERASGTLRFETVPELLRRGIPERA